MVTGVSSQSTDLHEKRDIELRILSAARAGDFALDRILGNGDNGVVVSAKCTRRGLPFSNKLYAVKILFNDNALRTRDIRDAFENEWEILSRIRTHPHIIRYWSQFVDVVPEVIARQSKQPTPNMQSQFVIMDYHENNFGKKRATLPTPLPVNKGLKYCMQLADGLVFLKSQGVLHMDLKPDNVLISDADDIIICDFGCAQQFDTESMRMQLMRGQPPGGNPAHLCPEVLNEFFRVQRGGAGPAMISYFRQTEWAYGCMVHEIIRSCHPFPEYPVRYGRPIQYYDRQIPALPASYPQEFQFVIRQLLSYEPTTRPAIKEVFTILSSCHQHEGEYNVEELKNKIHLLTERCQSAERERVETRRERDQTVRQLQELIAELSVVKDERSAVHASLERLKRENELANKNVSLLRLEQERDRRELVALRRERDVAQTMINQLRASKENPILFAAQQKDRQSLIKKWTSAAEPTDSTKSQTAVASRSPHLTPRKSETAGPKGPQSESGYISGGAREGNSNTPSRTRKRWGKAEIPGNLSSKPEEPVIPLNEPPKPKPDILFPIVSEKDKPVTPNIAPPGSPRRESAVLQKCRRCTQSFRENENHVGACRWHPGKVTVIDWGWMKVNVWDCCNETEGAGMSGCRGRAHMAATETRTGPSINTATTSLAVR